MVASGMRYLFIDFDGVICDSVDEAFVSSWFACRKTENSVSIEDKHLFCSYRPYIKSGADFIILQNCVKNKLRIESQEHFNRLYDGFALAEHKHNHKIFYAARTWLLEHFRDFWFCQNRLYPGMMASLMKLKSRSDVFILSTKKSEFILEILDRHQIHWPAERVLYSSSTEKIPIIESYLKTPADTAVLIDDQSECFREHSSVRFLLASWGYVADHSKAAELADEVINLADFDTVTAG